MDGSAVSAIRNTLSNGERTVKDMAHSSVLATQLLCGATAGVAAKTAIAPIERVKMTFQLSSEKFSLTSCCRKLVDTVKTEGVLKLWRGHSANIARVAPYAALHYSIHDIAEGFLHNSSSPTVSENKVLIQLISGSLAGGGATLVTYPLDVMRVRIAFGPSGLSFVQSWRAAFNHGGVWQGFVPTMLGVVPYSGTAWCAKEMFHRKYSAFAERPVDTKERLFLNAMAGLVGQLVTYP
jgi:solute carrier family 25, member 42